MGKLRLFCKHIGKQLQFTLDQQINSYLHYVTGGVVRTLLKFLQCCNIFKRFYLEQRAIAVLYKVKLILLLILLLWTCDVIQNGAYWDFTPKSNFSKSAENNFFHTRPFLSEVLLLLLLLLLLISRRWKPWLGIFCSQIISQHNATINVMYLNRNWFSPNCTKVCLSRISKQSPWKWQGLTKLLLKEFRGNPHWGVAPIPPQYLLTCSRSSFNPGCTGSRTLLEEVVDPILLLKTV